MTSQGGEAAYCKGKRAEDSSNVKKGLMSSLDSSVRACSSKTIALILHADMLLVGVIPSGIAGTAYMSQTRHMHN